MDLGSLARDVSVAARLGARRLQERIRGTSGHESDPVLWRRSFEDWLATLPPDSVVEHRFVELPAQRPPWTDSGLMLEPGAQVSWFATGRVYLSRVLGIHVTPSFQLWGRLGEHGTVFRGTRDSHTFVADAAGTLQLASYFPGEWATPQGTVGAGADQYGQVSGGMHVLVVRWSASVLVPAVLAASPAPPDLVRHELERLRRDTAPPVGWDYLWLLGPAEIFRPGEAPNRGPSICCDTHGDVGILRRAAACPLVPGTHLRWRWRVDELPAALREDTLPSHDYMSIAVEFDDGQDLTYYWSVALPVGTVYRCPLPTWRDKETHVVVRSGRVGLGAWLDEERDVHADYRRWIGGPARNVVRVWLIANSLFLRGHGRCEYAGIELGHDGARLRVL